MHKLVEVGLVVEVAKQRAVVPDVGGLDGLYRRLDGTVVARTFSSDQRDKVLLRAAGVSLMSADRDERASNP